MRRSLDQILERIDPARTLDPVADRLMDAFNAFQIPSARLKGFSEFRDCVSHFVRDMENVVLRIHPPFPLDPKMDFGHAYRLLVAEYGSQGEKVACNMAITGVSGGLNEVLRRLAYRLIMEYSGREIAARITVWWTGLNTEEKLAVSREYIKDFAHLLPADVVAGGAARLRMSFPKFLAEHPKMIWRYRQTNL